MVVLIYENGEAYEIEFVTRDGDTIALVTIPASEIRAVERIERVRGTATAA